MKSRISYDESSKTFVYEAMGIEIDSNGYVVGTDILEKDIIGFANNPKLPLGKIILNDFFSKLSREDIIKIVE